MSFISKWFYCFGLLLLPAGATAEELRNQLVDHGSAYLAMHGDDPVHWQQWNRDAVAKARQQNKLLYVSSGYFSCHWCHVMQRESYQNDRIAALLNEHFIPVKVDRELNPALDDRLIDFVERTRGHAGWPLNVFVTPEGYPLVGMVYQPPEDFLRILERIRSEWHNDAPGLRELAESTSKELQHRTPVDGTPQPDALRERFVNVSLERADELQGGFGDQNKFPSVPQLATLLRLHQEGNEAIPADFLHLTLDAMAEQGLRDHLSGGFFRYVIDPGWQVPHFEKMLYDNALLASIYLQAAQVLNHPAYRQVGLQTLAFMQREFQLANGGLLASFSALDGQGVEGGYYLWQTDELKQSLNEAEFEVASRYWGINGPPELDHGHHLHISQDLDSVAQTLNQPRARVEQLLDSARNKLLGQRRQRSLPRDTKQIAAWNGLALSAFVSGAQQEPALRASMQALRDFLVNQLWDGERLGRASGGDQSLGQVGLEDYAYVAQGLLDYATAFNDTRTLSIAEAVIRQAWQRFFSPAGWQLQQQPLLKYGARQAVLADGPMPSPSAALIRSTRTLLRQRPDPQLAKQLTLALEQGGGEIHENPFWHATPVLQLQQEHN
ncbi:MAG: thioredoxin domain-containing protein [Pseudomonadota bacterium]